MQKAGVRILQDPEFFKGKTTSFFFVTSYYGNVYICNMCIVKLSVVNNVQRWLLAQVVTCI